MKLIILCADGLDPEFAANLELHLPYEIELEIPKELLRSDGFPHTLDIWPSMFTGRICIYPTQIGPTVATGLRVPIRRWLHSHGISWHRKGMQIKDPKERARARVIHSTPRLYKPSVDFTVLDNYRAFKYNIPAVSHDFTFGVNRPYAMEEFNTVSELARMIQFIPFYDVSALYFRILDSLCHRVLPDDSQNLDSWYSRTFMLAKSLRCPVMLVSDHGCANGEHTLKAYLGCTEPVYSKTILDVHDDIKRILEGLTQ